MLQQSALTAPSATRAGINSFLMCRVTVNATLGHRSVVNIHTLQKSGRVMLAPQVATGITPERATWANPPDTDIRCAKSSGFPLHVSGSISSASNALIFRAM